MIKAILTFRTEDEDGLVKDTQTFYITDEQPLVLKKPIDFSGLTITLEGIEGTDNDQT